jgi:hypothetical protein
MSQSDLFVEYAKDRLAHVGEWARGSPWLERLARFGYASKGLVYLIIGALAVQAALGAGGHMVDMRGALRAIVRAPFGTVLLGVVGVGLVGYVVWRFVQAMVDTEHKGTEAKGLIQRAAYVVSGGIFANLTYEAVELIVDWGNSTNVTTEDWTALVLAQPLGPWIVGIAGGIVIGVGFYQLYAAYTATFRNKFKWGAMSDNEKRWVIRIGRIGHAARGMVFLIIGGFLIVAALQSNPERAMGLGEALQQFTRTPFGPWLLGLVALGLVAYAIYTLAEARYRRIMAS